jgi:Glycosyl transferase family 2
MSFFAGRTSPSLRLAAPVPDVVAIIVAHNEADILEASLAHLTGQGVGVYFIDNWSTDDSLEIARSFLGKGVLALERFPADPAAQYDFNQAMRRKAEVARQLGQFPHLPTDERSVGRWMIHYDADEFRESPWPGVSLRDGLLRVQSEGYNAIDHVVLHFVPTDEGFHRGLSPADYFRHFVSLRHMAPRRQIKTWVQEGQAIDLDTFAGHSAEFPGRRVYPIPFILRHYPIRSTAHGRKKILSERIPRFSRHSIEAGLHSHYPDLARAAAGPLTHSPQSAELEYYDEIPFKRAFLAQSFEPRDQTLRRQMQDLCHQLDAARVEILRLKQSQSALRYRLADRAFGVCNRFGALHRFARKMMK